MFIVFEGIDGAGTTTQYKMLSDYLTSLGKKNFTTCEPTSRPMGKLIRKYLKGEEKTDNESIQMLFAADRMDHINNVVKPKLKEGQIVISDRYFMASISYGSKDNINEFLFNIYENYIQPDIVFLLDLDVDTALSRINKRGEEKEIFENKDFLLQCIKNYKLLAKRYSYVQIIDASKSIDDVFNDVISKLGI